MRILTLLLLLLASGLEAQQLKWELGLFLGGANYQGDLVETQGPLLEETNIAYGGLARYNMGREWSLSLGVISGHISGSDQNFSDPYYTLTRNISFRSRITEAAFKIEWEPFGNRRYPKEGGYKKLFSPYFFTGFAYSILKSGADYTNVPRTVILEQVALDKASDKDNAYPAIPVGGGIKIDLSKYTVLYLEAGFRKTFSDLLDGVSQSGNPDTDDWYSFGGITLSRRFGLPDYDRDGIVDRMDACPRQAGVASAQGCPDSDGDGVEDLEDVCPLAFGVIELNGCPDSDGDMVIDINDSCPFTAGLEKYDGCPDTDGDGIIDKEDRCPDVAGVFEEQGCPYPDTDADGVIDKEDDCPNTPGVPEERGCPLPDTDLDGVVDTADACPNLPGLAALGGCPDTDADGIIDTEDRCPNTPGLSVNEGCPEIEEEEKALLKLAMETVQFETASAILKSTSLDILNQIADILNKYPDYGLNISGHTDSQGNDDKNQTLSEKRAQSCYDYFASTGIASDRMTHQGFGETKPIGDNITLEGRRINRRVEFELFIQEKTIVNIPLLIKSTPDSSAVAAYAKTTPSHSDSSKNIIPDLLPQLAEELQAVEGTNWDSLLLAENTTRQVSIDSFEAEPTEDLIPSVITTPIAKTAEETNQDSLLLVENIAGQISIDPSSIDLTPEITTTPIAKTTEKTSPDSLQLVQSRDGQVSTDSLDTQPDLSPGIIESSIVETTTANLSIKSPKTTETVRPRIENMAALTTRSIQTPDTIYWFEPNSNPGFAYKKNMVIDIELPKIYLQSDTVANPLEMPSLEKQGIGTGDDVPIPSPTVQEKPTEYVPKALMEKKVETLEQRIEALEERIRLLEQLIIKQNPAVRDSLKMELPPKENKPIEKKGN